MGARELAVVQFQVVQFPDPGGMRVLGEINASRVEGFALAWNEG